MGEYLGRIGSKGAGNGLFNEPRGLALGPAEDGIEGRGGRGGGVFFVCDSMNHSIQVLHSEPHTLNPKPQVLLE